MNETYQFPNLKIIKLALIGGAVMLAFTTVLLFFLTKDRFLISIMSAVLVAFCIFDFFGYLLIKNFMMRPLRLLNTGTPIPAKFTGVAEAFYGGKRHLSGFAIAVKTEDGKEYKSHTFTFDPRPYAPENFTIYFDVKNPKNYFVDTRPVFAAKGKKPKII
ncbi:MAG: hypothetical protein LBI01_01685 [Elusimicrobium sp.]|jgi:hypothetical protein|nr:hypothetical protein [Elusimicrobium sp.]